MTTNSPPSIKAGGNVFTTGQVSKICNVAPRTVSKWCDAGRIQSWKIPGSLDRRISRDALLAFMREHNIPIKGELEGDRAFRLLLVGFGPDDERRIEQALAETGLPPNTPEIKTHAASNAFVAGLRFERVAPHAVAVDVATLGRIDACQVAAGVRDGAKGFDARLVATAAEGEPEGPLVRGGFDVVVRGGRELAAALVKMASYRGRRSC